MRNRNGGINRLAALRKFGLNKTAPYVAPERHYLPFDGINDYAHALTAAASAVAAGTSGEVALIVKAADTMATVVGIYAHLADVTGSPSTSTEGVTAALAYALSTTATVTRAWDSAGGGSTQFTHTLASAGPVTYAMNRRNTTRLLQGIVARAGVNLSTAAAIPTVDRNASHVIFGARVNLALTPQNFGPLRFVAGVLLTRNATTAEVEAYSAGADARIIWPDAISHYWTASAAVGASIAATVGTVPLTLVGGIAATDRVAL